MKFPKRIKQHKGASDSYAILLYKLRDLGIFRNSTENDYGIDFEIELVDDGKLLGKYLKAQVKSSEKLKIRKSDSVPTVGGIKQSTLAYWAELSHKTHVIAYAVDTSTEDIYISLPLFWQAIRLIDGKSTSKTIEFMKPDSVLPSHLTASELTKIIANSPALMDVIYCHKLALKHLESFFDLYADVFHYDATMEVEKLDLLETFLDVCKVLLWDTSIESTDLTAKEIENIYLLSYWQHCSDKSFGEYVTNIHAQKPLKALMPYLLNSLKQYESRVFKSKYYWSYKSVAYLKLVYDFPIPDANNHDEISNISYNGYNTSRKDGGFQFFLSNSKSK